MERTEKEKLEEAAVSYFLEWYAENRARLFKIVNHQDKPDFVVQEYVPSDKVGVEVAHLFQDDAEARMLLGRSQERVHPTVSLSDLIKRLNSVLIQKAAKVEDYDFPGDVFLVIRVASPIFDRELFESHRADINVPPCKFSEIWLLFRDVNRSSWSEVLQLK
ncbi:MAG: hypothetical protein IH955_03010 [Chloroflexi bacterium]|nr:hypothetical protein [Chloroflexota bacterium]